jgi:ATP synthase protein I
MNNNNFKNAFRSADVAASGLALVLSVAIGFGLGFMLDAKFGTSPYLTLAFFTLGVAAGVFSMIKLIKRLKNADK